MRATVLDSFLARHPWVAGLVVVAMGATFGVGVVRTETRLYPRTLVDGLALAGGVVGIPALLVAVKPWLGRSPWVALSASAVARTSAIRS